MQRNTGRSRNERIHVARVRKVGEMGYQEGKHVDLRNSRTRLAQAWERMVRKAVPVQGEPGITFYFS